MKKWSDWNLEKRRAFMKLPMRERRRILRRAAQRYVRENTRENPNDTKAKRITQETW